MKNSIVIASLFLGACATTGSTGSKSSSAPFPGKDALKARRDQIVDASKGAMDCLKVKDAGKGGVFAVVADANGKLSAQTISYDGPQTIAQCVVDAANKSTVAPFGGPPVGVLWSFWAPGAEPPQEQMPDSAKGALNTLHERMQAEVDLCGQRFLGEGFPADIEVGVFVAADGNVYAPTVTDSTAKDGGFDSCVRDVVAKTKFPAIQVNTLVYQVVPFHYGRSEKL
jgi:hypothetical protein